jgi:hypothetical protein
MRKPLLFLPGVFAERYENGKFGNEVLPIKDHGGGSVTPRPFQPVQKPAIGQCRQPLGGNAMNPRKMIIVARGVRPHFSYIFPTGSKSAPRRTPGRLEASL